MPSYAVKYSKIHGKGLFATRDIPEGEVIGVYEGPRVYTDDEDGDHVLWVEEEDGILFGIDGRNDLRYVNHNLEPNASFEGEELLALKWIPRGAEITHHYGDDWEDVG